MSNVITIGKRLIPAEQIALVEPYDASTNQRIQTDRTFLGRAVLVNRDSVLIEQAPQTFAQANGFRWLELDGVGANPVVCFRIEKFEASKDFRPSKPFATRLLWRDLEGEQQSKLLLTAPEAVLATLVAENPGAEPAPQAKPRRTSRRRRRAGTAAPVTHP